MRVGRCFRVVCSAAGLVLHLAAVANAQERVRDSISTQATVSVASLRVSPKAREHYEKARHAAQEHRDGVYEREISKALAISPAFPEAYVLMADRDNKAYHYEDAIEHAAHARALDPSDAWAPIVLASAYNGLRRYDDAFLLLETLNRVTATHWQAQYEMARAETGRGDVEGALRWSRMALAAAPASWADAHLVMANALQLASQWREACREMELYLAADTTPAHKAAVEIALQHARQIAEQQEQERGKVALR